VKTCFKCGAAKPIAEFYTHSQMGDGHLNKCKTCTKADVAKRIEEKKQDPAWMAAERARCRAKIAKQRSETGIKQPTYAVKEKWRKANRPKVRAELRARRAYSAGVLQKPSACQMCGQVKKLVMHHPDYSKPLAVWWLCTGCHGIVHRKDQQ
jgi:hypothetical protein